MRLHAAKAVLLTSVVISLSMWSPVSAGPLPTPSEMAAGYLHQHPGGVLEGNEVHYPDGSGFVAVESGVTSISQCSSNQFCMWSSTNYAGSFTYVTGSGVTRSLNGTVRSIWNNRSKRAFLYNNVGTSSTCYGSGAKDASLTSAYQYPTKVYLSSGSAC